MESVVNGSQGVEPQTVDLLAFVQLFDERLDDVGELGSKLNQLLVSALTP